MAERPLVISFLGGGGPPSSYLPPHLRRYSAYQREPFDLTLESGARAIMYLDDIDIWSGKRSNPDAHAPRPSPDVIFVANPLGLAAEHLSPGQFSRLLLGGSNVARKTPKILLLGGQTTEMTLSGAGLKTLSWLLSESGKLETRSAMAPILLATETVAQSAALGNLPSFVMGVPSFGTQAPLSFIENFLKKAFSLRLKVSSLSLDPHKAMENAVLLRSVVADGIKFFQALGPTEKHEHLDALVGSPGSDDDPGKLDKRDKLMLLLSRLFETPRVTLFLDADSDLEYAAYAMLRNFPSSGEDEIKINAEDAATETVRLLATTPADSLMLGELTYLLQFRVAVISMAESRRFFTRMSPSSMPRKQMGSLINLITPRGGKSSKALGDMQLSVASTFLSKVAAQLLSDNHVSTLCPAVDVYPREVCISRALSYLTDFDFPPPSET